MILNGQLSIVLDVIASKVITPAFTAVIPVKKTFPWTIVNGIGVGQANEFYFAERTLASGVAEDLDFSGPLLDLFGDAFVLVKLKAIIIGNKAANTTNLTVSRPAANGVALFGAASDALAIIPPGYAFLYMNGSAAGLAVTAGTADLVNIANSAGASAIYDVVGIGTDA